MIHLKRHVYTEDLRQDFAVLVDPDLTGIVRSDAELYEVISKRTDPVTIALMDNITHPSGPEALLIIPPQEFIENWRGD